ncbi:hypothetical protein [Erythrobacter rubeus]|uniref:Uncharacterized protein n=1 Tax=Erythrobacter rubeus TaxID=2760803 RepID=A0ABR8KM01_9SPHN|nr:hypothetical protein [Erythrobacter rubeus]MBD2841506.1 hypothetical protein [Erythrobacter rubeus]
MLNFPRSPDAGCERLAAYLAADPDRCPVYENIAGRLTPDGRFGIIARYYVIRCAFRRAVFRGVLIATGQKLPSWAKETPEAAEKNRVFVARYRLAYNAYRVDCRRG